MKTRILVSAAIAALLLSSCAQMFQERVPLTTTGETATLREALERDETVTKLETPAQFYVAPYYSATDIRLSWSSVDGAAYYMVERAECAPLNDEAGNPVWQEPSADDYVVLERFVYGAAYTDAVLKSATLESPEYRNRYYYRVTAFNPAKKYDESDPTEPRFAMLFSAPKNLKASGGVSVEYIDVSWGVTPGAASYEIWRSENPDGTSASFLGRVSGNQTVYRNRVSESQQGKDFYYSITAINGFGKNSLQTRPAYGYARVAGAPDEPKKVRLAENSGRGNSTGEIKIEWDGTGDATGDAEYYAVYRYSTVDSALTRLAEKTTALSYTDKQALKPGIYYYYRVQAVREDIASGKILKSQFSSPDPEGFILSPPDTVVAEKSGGSIVIKWLPSIGDENERGGYTYNVYASASQDGVFTLVSSASSATDADGYICATGLSASYSFFRVTTVNGGTESQKSYVVSPAPAPAVILKAGRYEKIADDAQANPNGVYPVKITWKKPDDENPAFYHVQRSVKTGSGFARITDEALPAKTSNYDDGTYSYNATDGTYTFIDKNETAKVGRKYYYRVLSLNSLGQGSFPSEERIGWGALTHTQYMLEYNRTMKSALKKLTLMYKSPDTAKLGSESKTGTIGGSISYNAALDGLGARIIIRLENYTDFYIENDSSKGAYFTLTGNSNTSANMSSNGSMDGTMRCEGMYPGYVYYDRIDIKGGGAAGGTYGVHPDGFGRAEIHWTVGEQ